MNDLTVTVSKAGGAESINDQLHEAADRHTAGLYDDPIYHWTYEREVVAEDDESLTVQFSGFEYHKGYPKDYKTPEELEWAGLIAKAEARVEQLRPQADAGNEYAQKWVANHEAVIEAMKGRVA